MVMNMNKKLIVIIIGIIIIIILLGIIFFNNNKDKNDIENSDEYFTFYNTDDNILSNISTKKEVIETIENTTIQGVVELNRNEHIYIFNGQHFGEYGFEMEEYTRANIDNKGQECVDYYTLEKYDTSYIEEGDIIIATGDLTSYSTGEHDLDTKDNPITVLKSEDYEKIKQEAIRNERESTISVGQYYEMGNEIYLKYDVSDNQYSLPFALKFTITDDTRVIGNLENGKTLKIQYKDLDVAIESLELEAIEVIEE